MPQAENPTNNALAVIPQRQVETIRRIMGGVQRLLPSHVSGEEFRGALMLYLETNSKVAQCSPISLAKCIFQAAGKGMLPGTDCFFRPGWSKHTNGYEAAFIPGFQGMIRHLHASGCVASVPPPQVVREGDHFAVDFGANTLTHVPTYGATPRSRQPVLAIWALVIFTSGARVFDVMDWAEIEAVRDRVKDWQKTAWKTDPVEMGRKTVTRRLYKRLQLPNAMPQPLPQPTAETVKAIVADLFGDRMPSEALGMRPDTAALPAAAAGDARVEPDTGEVMDDEWDEAESAAIDAEFELDGGS